MKYRVYNIEEKLKLIIKIEINSKHSSNKSLFTISIWVFFNITWIIFGYLYNLITSLKVKSKGL